MSNGTATPEPAVLSAVSHCAHFVFAYMIDWREDSRGRLRERCESYRTWLLSFERERLFRGLGRKQADGPEGLRLVWETVEPIAARKSLHQDLMPVVDRILHGNGYAPDSTEDSKQFAGLPPLCVEKELLGARFHLKLNPQAKKRLSDQRCTVETIDNIGASLDQVQLYTVASGIVLLSIGLRFFHLAREDARLPLPVIEEAMYALGHAADREQLLHSVETEYRTCLEDLSTEELVVVDQSQRWALRRATDDERERPAIDGPLKPRRLARSLAAGDGKQIALFDGALGHFSLRQFAGVLAGCPHENRPDSFSALSELGAGEHGRVFTIAAVLCDGEAGGETLETIAYRLSRRFTIDYQLDEDDVRRSCVRTFENVLHAVCTQGAAVVVRRSEAAFVQSFIASAFAPVYRPLGLLAYHEYLLLLNLTQGAAFIPNPLRPEEDMQQIQALRYELAKFRLFFRFSHLSDVSHHNRVHRAWRDALDLDRMLHDLMLDVREADKVLARADLEHRTERWRGVATLLAFMAALVTASEIADLFLKLFFPWQDWVLQLLHREPCPRPPNSFIRFILSAVGLGQPSAGPSSAECLADDLHTWEIVATVAAICAAAVVAYWAWKKGPQLEE